jgi:hypothetical protein
VSPELISRHLMGMTAFFKEEQGSGSRGPAGLGWAGLGWAGLGWNLAVTLDRGWINCVDLNQAGAISEGHFIGRIRRGRGM